MFAATKQASMFDKHAVIQRYVLDTVLAAITSEFTTFKRIIIQVF